MNCNTLAALASLLPPDGHEFGEMFDLSRVFEDEFDYGCDDMLAPRPIAPTSLMPQAMSPTGVLSPQMSRNPHSNPPSPPPQQQQPQHSQDHNQSPLVNVFFLVDPATQQVILPHSFLPLQSDDKNTSINNSSMLLSSLGNMNLVGLGMNAFHSFNFTKDDTHLSAPPSQQTNAPTPVSPTNDIQSSASIFSSPTLPQLNSQLSSPTLNVQTPLRALSAYNFFFRDERDRILYGKDHDWTPSKQEQLLQDHWCRDRSKKRRHRKSHGKIDFTTLSKLISTRWKELSEDRKDFYREVASRDWKRYQTELNEYKVAVSDVMAIPSSTNLNSPFQEVVG